MILDGVEIVSSVWGNANYSKVPLSTQELTIEGMLAEKSSFYTDPQQASERIRGFVSEEFDRVTTGRHGLVEELLLASLRK